MKSFSIIVSTLVMMLAVGLLGCTATQEPTITQDEIPDTPPVIPNINSSLDSFPQVISCTTEPGVTTNDYVRYLRVGDQVTGAVQLTSLEREDDFHWIFTIFYRGNNDQIKSFFQNWQDGDVWQNKHAFGFSVQKEGEYTLRISVSSKTYRDFRLDIEPAGWR